MKPVFVPKRTKLNLVLELYTPKIGEGGFYPIVLQKYQKPLNLAYFGVLCLLQAGTADIRKCRPCFALRSRAQINFLKPSFNMPAIKTYRANEYLTQCIREIPFLKDLKCVAHI